MARFKAWISSFVHTTESEPPLSRLSLVGESGRPLEEEEDDDEEEEEDLRLEADVLLVVNGATEAEAAALATICPKTLVEEPVAVAVCRFFSKSKAYNSLATVDGIDSLLVILSNANLHFVVRK